jgi:hypothetical protein
MAPEMAERASESTARFVGRDNRAKRAISSLAAIHHQ